MLARDSIQIGKLKMGFRPFMGTGGWGRKPSPGGGGCFLFVCSRPERPEVQNLPPTKVRTDRRRTGSCVARCTQPLQYQALRKSNLPAGDRVFN